MNIAHVLDDHPSDSVALVSRGDETTYGELRDQVARLAGGLRGLGLDEGDRVAIICAANWYFAVSYLATVRAGLVAVPLNPQSPPAEIERNLAAVGARVLIVGPAGSKSVSALDRSAVPALEHLVACRGKDIPGAGQLDDLLTADPSPCVERARDDLAVLMFTSGTGGAPRAAMLSHGNLLSNIEAVQEDPDRRRHADDVVLGVIPMFHIFGLNVILTSSPATGAQVVLVERFDPTSALETIAERQITDITGPPTMWGALAGHPGATPDHMATVRRATSGASKLASATARAVQEQMGLDLDEGYGLTETSPVVSTTLGTDAPVGSVGRPIAGVQVRLVDEDGDDVFVGDPGEIWVRGPNVFLGYWDDAEATAEALTEDGWLRTGDLALVDDAGYLYLVDRIKDLIIVSGFNVHPAEVEEILLAHADVAEAAVVGVPHPHTGEAVKAFVVAEDDRAVEEGELIDHVRVHLAGYKAPSKVDFVDDLPQNATGKVLRRELG